MKILTLFVLAWILFQTAAAFSAELKAAHIEEQAQEADVDKIKEKYWARGQESELGVVQNRTYSKARKFNAGLIGGTVFSDPFLSTKILGGSLGYHFNETLGVQALAWKAYVSPSTALQTFEEFRGATANTNPPQWYAGTEATASIIYGKLSLAGLSIIYYDLHGIVGAGITQTESGRYATPHVGIGQRFFLSRLASLRIDYRLMGYRETIVEKEIPTKLGEPVGSRNNWSNTISIGVDFHIGFWP